MLYNAMRDIALATAAAALAIDLLATEAAAEGGSKASKTVKTKASAEDDLSWLAGQWWLCDERQTRLINSQRYRTYTYTTQCSDVFGFNITAITEDRTNFLLENGGFEANCVPYGIPPDSCGEDGKGVINEVFVGAVSLNPKWRDEVAFVGKRVEYRDANGEWVPVSTLSQGYLTTLRVDVTDREHLHVDWTSTLRRYTAKGAEFDLMSVRSWMLVKDLKASCHTCDEDKVWE